MKHLLGILNESYLVTKEAGIYLFFGFLIAGLIKAFMKEEVVSRSLGKNNFSSVLKSTLIGIPLPLCSCSVIPVAMSLKKQGASKGAVTSFLISTPETGVDSIAISWSLLDPILTIFRPFIAFVTSIFAGISQNIFSKKEPKPISQLELLSTYPEEIVQKIPEKLSWWKEKSNQLISGVRYAFTDLLSDIAVYLIYGILITGLLTYIIPDNFFSQSYEHPITSMFIMLGLGIPIYICATASTPIAGALILKGLNPGAALVFLLVGPATNMITLSVVYKTMHKRGLIIYLSSLIVASLLGGFLLDYIYKVLSLNPKAMIGQYGDLISDSVKHVFGILLSGYLIYIGSGKLYWKIKKYTTRKEM